MTEEQIEARRQRCAELGRRTQAANARAGAAKAAATRTKHGHAKRAGASPEYHAWEAIVQRCTNPKNPRWKNYGGRGITVCERWLVFESFLADVGPRPSPELSIDRIDNDRGYEPGNVRWATRAQQHANQRHHGRARC